MDDSDLALLSSIRRGDSEALGIILERHWAPLVGYACSILDNRDAAEDVAQETFVRLWERREVWKPAGSVRALLFRVARNLSVDELRRRSACERTERAAPRQPLRLLPDEEAENREIKDIIARAVASLPQRRREVFILVRYHGLSYRETAAVLDLSVQTVANHLTMALADLRNRLTPHLYERADLLNESQTHETTDRSARDRVTDAPA